MAKRWYEILEHDFRTLLDDEELFFELNDRQYVVRVATREDAECHEVEWKNEEAK